ncbi:MAG: hypothetical protein J0H40_22835 [Rhizobiales bacterium]|nr:hypothetical protein [Hyphomicrobiales bacterium]
MAPMFDPSSDLPDGTLIEVVRLPLTMRNALTHAGLKTIGEVRAATNDELHFIPDIGANSVTYLRLTLGLRTT